MKDRLNSENKAIWERLQYRYRNKQNAAMDEALNAYIKPYLINLGGTKQSH